MDYSPLPSENLASPVPSEYFNFTQLFLCFPSDWGANGIFGVYAARKMGRDPKNERGGRGGEGRFPSFLFLAHAPFFARATPTPRKRLLRRLTKVETYRKFYQQFYFRNGKPRRILMTITLENGSKLSSSSKWAPECDEWH